jgi:hypothetical protein
MVYINIIHLRNYFKYKGLNTPKRAKTLRHDYNKKLLCWWPKTHITFKHMINCKDKDWKTILLYQYQSKKTSLIKKQSRP